jgi:hypothetical protein
MKEKLIEVEAEVIEEKGLTVSFTPASIQANFEALDAHVEAMIADYKGAKYDLTSQEGIKQAKHDATYLNSIAKEIDDRRKAVKRDYMEPYNQFDMQATAIIKKVKDTRADIKEQLDAAEEERKAKKYAALQEYFEGYAGVLIDLVPYERIHENQWLNKTFNEIKAQNAIEEKVNKIASDWESLKSQSDMAHYDTAERTFFDTLDLGEALSAARKAQEADERIAELHREVEQIQEEQIAEEIEEKIAPAVEELQEAPMQEAAIQPEEIPAPPAPPAPLAPEPIAHPLPKEQTAIPGGEYIPCVMVIQAASQEQMKQIGAFCGSLTPKVVGRFIGGTIEQAYMKIQQEAGTYYGR